jgi:hypothetical protein
MTAYFTAEALEQMDREYSQVRVRYEDLLRRYLSHEYKSDLALANASQGFLRRASSLARAIELVFKALPPGRDIEDIPEREEVVDATIAIQSSVFNTFGCLDNLAWIWVYEKGMKIQPTDVGLWRKHVRSSFSVEFRAYLEGHRNWFDAMKELRDSLAHRIPLYIPPYTVIQSHADEHNRLERAANEALRRLDLDEHDRLESEQKKLGRFRPLIGHSLDGSNAVVFHPQLLANFNTVYELGQKMLEELDR